MTVQALVAYAVDAVHAAAQAASNDGQPSQVQLDPAAADIAGGRIADPPHTTR